MHSTLLSYSAVLLIAISVSACSGNNFGYPDFASNTQYSHSQNSQNTTSQDCFLGAQAALTQPNYISNSPQCINTYNQANDYAANTYAASGLRGSSSPYYSDTVLQGNAPYGRAVNNRAYLQGRHINKQSGVYGNLGAILYDEGTSPAGIQGRLGYSFNKYAAAEIEGSWGANKDEDNDGIDYSVGAFGVAKLPIGRRVSLLARAGYHHTQFNISDIEIKRDGAAYGGGLEVALGRRESLRLDYTRYEHRDNVRTDSISASYVQKF